MNALPPSPDGHRILRLDTYWPYQITVLADRISRHTAAIVRQHAGLNLSQWRVMAAIAEQPGRTAAEVVSVTPMDKGIVSRATKALLAAGLVVRRASQEDGRASHLHLTTDGEAMYQSLVPRVEAVSMQAQDTLTHAEREQFEASLKRLSALLTEPVSDGQPGGQQVAAGGESLNTKF
tara:strand:+ start:8614 stop:9147 length:534 start_codon:yes stop_codon:yes gene_type:complete